MDYLVIRDRMDYPGIRETKENQVCPAVMDSQEQTERLDNQVTVYAVYEYYDFSEICKINYL